MGLYMGYIGLYRIHIGIMEKKMETTIVYWITHVFDSVDLSFLQCVGSGVTVAGSVSAPSFGCGFRILL